jgi:thiopeptide-type bacteriocin biosynthesis protein
MKDHYRWLPGVLLRTPAHSYHGQLPIEELLNDPLFRAAIFLASPGLYHELEKRAFRVDRSAGRIWRSVNNYANRMSHRTTPFGAFSAFSWIADRNTAGALVIHEEPFRLHVAADIRDVFSMDLKTEQQAESKTLIHANHTIYALGQALRFYVAEYGGEQGRHYSIQEIPAAPYLKRLVRYLNVPKTFAALHAFCQRQGMGWKEASSLLNDLIGLQFLLPEPQPVLIAAGVCYPLSQDLTGLGKNGAALWSAGILDRSSFAVLPKRRADAGLTSLLYTNLERSIGGGLPEFSKKAMEDAVFALRKLSIADDPLALVNFRKAFAVRFENRVVPLLEAIDPNAGVPYDGLPYPPASELLEGLDIWQKEKAPAKIEWGQIQQLILKKWDGRKVICLTKEDLNNLPDHNQQMPPSISLLFSIENGRLRMDRSGGNSATALFGRFTPLNPDVHAQCLELANEESLQNPEVLFAELSFFTGDHTDNVSRRRQIRKLEIPVLTGSALSGDGVLALSELHLQISDGQLILWSEKHDKRIIPRLSSAYNHQRSELSVFRLLADLQYQSLQCTWELNMQALLPGLAFYPRVVYRSCVLSVATWVINVKEIMSAEQTEVGRYKAFVQFAEEAGLAMNFALCHADQYLVFSLKDTESIMLFIQEVADMKEIILKEVDLETRNASITDHTGDAYAGQFIGQFVRTDSAYPKAYSKPELGHRPMVRRELMLGSEWAYYKLYGALEDSNEVLNKLKPVLTRLKRKGILKQWFFVRYKDPAPHLRIRLQTDRTGDLVTMLYPLLDKLLKLRYISRVATDTYVRELERYPAPFIDSIENLFCISAELVLTAFKYPGHDAAFYLALRSTYDMVRTISDPVKRLAFLATGRKSLLHEFGEGRALIAGLDKRKREFRGTVAQLINDVSFYQKKGLKKQIDRMVEILTNMPFPDLSREELLSDLVHMHINRAFQKDMRLHELLVYTLLYQYELTLQKRENDYK